MRVTPTLVQAAEAVLRDALEPALALRDESDVKLIVKQVRPCKGIPITAIMQTPTSQWKVGKSHIQS